MAVEILSGHTSPETAVLVDDYPYGFRLRCKIRYWLEYKAKRGFRFVSQTSNPKKPGLVWNKPKASTYSDVMAMTRDSETGHIGHVAESFAYSSIERLESAQSWPLPDQAKRDLVFYCRVKRRYEELKLEHPDFAPMALSRQASFEIAKTMSEAKTWQQ